MGSRPLALPGVLEYPKDWSAVCDHRRQPAPKSLRAQFLTCEARHRSDQIIPATWLARSQLTHFAEFIDQAITLPERAEMECRELASDRDLSPNLLVVFLAIAHHQGHLLAGLSDYHDPCHHSQFAIMVGFQMPPI